MWKNHSGIWYFWSPFAAGRGVCSCWLTRVSGKVKKTDQPPAGSSNTIFLFSVFLGLVEIFIRALESKTLWRKKILIHMQNTTSVWIRIFEFVLGFLNFISILVSYISQRTKMHHPLSLCLSLRTCRLCRVRCASWCFRWLTGVASTVPRNFGFSWERLSPRLQ